MQRIRPRHQERATRTARALARAAHELMQETPFDLVPVSEIVRRAGVSVGAFYARFGCKEALLDWLCQELVGAEGEEVRRRLAELDRRGASLRELVTRYVALAAEFHQRNAVLLREVMRLAYRATDDVALRQTVHVNDEVDRALVELLLARRDEIGHPDPERVARFVPPFVAAMLRTFILLAPALEGRQGRRAGPARQKEIVEWILSALKVRAGSPPARGTAPCGGS